MGERPASLRRRLAVQTDDAGFAYRINSIPRYVVFSTLDHCDWSGSQPLIGDVAEKVRTLKKESGRVLLLSGSAQLLNMLRQKDIIDLYRLMVHPILLGKGRRLLAEGTDEKALTLTHMQAFSSGIVILEYESAPRP